MRIAAIAIAAATMLSIPAWGGESPYGTVTPQQKEARAACQPKIPPARRKALDMKDGQAKVEAFRDVELARDAMTQECLDYLQKAAELEH